MEISPSPPAGHSQKSDAADTSIRRQWLADCAEPLRPVYYKVLGISFFSNLLVLAVPIFTLQVYDRVISHNAFSTLIALSLGVMLALGFDFLLRQSRNTVLQHVSAHIDASLGKALFTKFSRLPLRLLESRPTNYWQTVFSDILSVRTVMGSSTATLLADIPFALLFVMIVGIIATPVLPVILFIVPAFLALTWFSNRIITYRNSLENREQQNRDHLMAELLAARTTAKALGIDRALEGKFEQAQAHTIHTTLHKAQSMDRLTSIGLGMASLTTALLVIVGALAIIDREMTAGALIATTMLASRIITPFNQLLSSWKQFAQFRLALQRLDAFFALPEDNSTALERPTPTGHLRFERVGYGFEAGKPPVVENISLDIAAGEMVGIVGRNGSGKTTLLKLAMGLYPAHSGRVLLDEGDIQQFSRAQLTRWCGYVPQENILFSGSIRDNIAKALPEATDEQVLAAALAAGADSFIRALPHGYQTEVGERGMRLSGGERQRIAIARALLQQPPLLCFDEISSNLDSEAEMALRQQLLGLAGKHTILLVTHSPLMLQACHKIVVMERGQISLFGPAQEILSRLMRTPTTKEANS
jgi:ATP-binding cassette subfamily C protein LapB